MFPIHSHGSFLQRIARGLRWLMAGLALLAALSFSACDIASPELPIFTTILNLPFERQEVLMADLVEDEELLFSDSEGGLYIFLEGDSLRVDLDQDMSVELESQESTYELGLFTLEAGEAGNFDFDLSEIYPDILLLPPGTVPVPPFAFVLNPETQDIEDVESAHVESGYLRAIIDNQFQVPLSGQNMPYTLRCEIRDTSSGALIDMIEFLDEIPPGAADTALVDMSGATLPDSVSVRITGGSEGHAGVEDVDPYRVLNILVDFVDLSVDQATAVVGEQSMVETRFVEIGDSLAILDGSISSGSMVVTLGNHLPIHVQAELFFDEIFDAGGTPISAHLHLGPGEEGETFVDLANASILAPGSEPLEQLGYRVEMSSPGSAGETVFIQSSDFLSSSVSAAEISLDECTGRFPEKTFDLDPVSENLDLPEELAGVHFTEAIMVLDVLNEVQIPAQLNIHMESQYESGSTLELNHVAQILPADGRSGKLTRVVLDSSNSILPEMLSGAPNRIELSGNVVVGGDVIGTAALGLGAEVRWSVEAPLRASIEATEIQRDPFELDLDDDMRETLSDHLYSAKLMTEIDNALPLGLELRFVVGADSMTVFSHPIREIGPFVVGAASTDASGFVDQPLLDSQELDLDNDDLMALIGQGNYVAVVVDMPGTGGEEIAFRPSDYLAVRGMLQAEINSSEN